MASGVLRLWHVRRGAHKDLGSPIYCLRHWWLTLLALETRKVLPDTVLGANVIPAMYSLRSNAENCKKGNH
jgi:hypothetical protein